MKTRLTRLKLLIILCSTFATTAVFGQTTYTWTGAADGTNIAVAGNWTTNGSTPAVTLPTGATQDTAQWDGVTTSNLLIWHGNPSLPGTGYGTSGINLNFTANQTNSVQLVSAFAQSPTVGINNITITGPSGALSLGDDSANVFNIIGRPAGAIHDWINNSTNPAIIYPNVRWQAGGGSAYTLAFDGTGNWIVTNNLTGAGGVPTYVAMLGSGTLTWAGPSIPAAQGNNVINSPVVIYSGTVILASSGLLANQAIQNNGTLLQYDAAAQSQTLGGVISGSAPLKVSNGALTLSGASTFTGNIELNNNGELIVSGPENPGVSGPLGVGGTISFTGGTLGFSLNNVFDYSARFSTAAGQQYKFDTGGQSVTLATGLSSSSGTLTKTGSGTLMLTGASTYTGLTTVSNGKLVFQGSKSGTGDITVADGAALGVTATGTQVTPGTLTMGTSGGVTLEFNNITSTTTAPLAAGTLSSAGTVTVNINSGTFAIGQSYPLLTWGSGSAPAVSLGTLNCAGGNLSISGNTLYLNIVALNSVWTGLVDGNWDNPSNWKCGLPGFLSPVLFDDTAPGTTTVIVDIMVQPWSVTVNNSTKTYSIASSSGNNIAGGTSLTKSGSGTLTLSGGANTYTGVTTLSGGTVSIGMLTNGGSASDIGKAASSAANLVLDGGTLQYTGGGAGSDRLFTLGTAGGTIDASGYGALNLNNAGSIGYSSPGARVLTLTGTVTDTNTLAGVIANNGGATSVSKSGAGTWVLGGNNTYSGATTITAGTLQVGTGGAAGSTGSGNIVNNGSLVFNRSGTLTVGGVVSGNGPVTVQQGTVILPGNNSYQNVTTISNGATLQIGTGGAAGSLYNGVSSQSVSNYGTIIYNSTGSFSQGGGGFPVSGTGNLIKRGSGTLKLIGPNDYTGWTFIDAGATLQVCEGNQGALSSSVVTNNGTLKLVRQDWGVFFYTNPIVGSGNLVRDVNNFNDGDVTLSGNNTYTGGTIIAGGHLVLGDGTNASGSIVGNVLFTNSAITDTPKSLTWNRPDNVTFSGLISGSGSTVGGNQGQLVQNGFGVLTITANNDYAGGTVISNGTLQVGAGGTSGSIGTGPVTDNGVLVFNRSDDVTVSNVIIGGGSLVKLGAGKLTLTATNTYEGTTTVSNGTLFINGGNSGASTVASAGALGGTGTFYGPVTLAAGTTLAPGASGGSVGTLTINGGLTIAGNLAIDVNKSLSPSNDLVVVSGALNNTGSGTLTVANFGPALAVGDKFTLFSKPVQNGAALTVTGAGATWANNLAVDGSITVTAVSRPTLTYTQAGNSLQFSWNTSFGSFRLQAQTNSLNVGLRTNWADYPGGGTSPVTVPMDTAKATVFFRLVSP